MTDEKPGDNAPIITRRVFLARAAGLTLTLGVSLPWRPEAALADRNPYANADQHAHTYDYTYDYGYAHRHAAHRHGYTDACSAGRARDPGGYSVRFQERTTDQPHSLHGWHPDRLPHTKH